MESYSISKGKSLASGFSSRWRKKLEDDEKERQKQQAIDNQKRSAEQEKNTNEKNAFQKVGDFVAEKARDIGAGIQQGAGAVADVALEGGGVLDELGNQIRGGTEEEKNKRREQNIAGTEAARQKLHSLTDINGQNIGGTTDVDESAGRIASGRGSARDIAAVGGKGLEVGLDATQFLNPTRLLTRAAGKEAARGTTKDALKFAARDTAFYGTGNAAATGAKTYGETGDIGKATEEGVKSGLLSAATQGTLDIAGHATGRLINRARGGKPNEAPKADEPAATTDPLAAEEANAAEIIRKANEDKSSGQFSRISDDELARQVEQFQSGERTGNTERDYQRYADLQAEVQHRQNVAEKKDFLNNGLPNDVEGAQKALDAHDAGELPDSAYRPAQPVRNAEEIINRPDIPVEIKQAAEEVQNDRNMVHAQLETLMSPSTQVDDFNRLDEQYAARQEEISQLPPQRQQIEQANLDDEYQQAVSEINMMIEKDRPEVEKYNAILDQLDTREQNIVMDTRNLMQNAPDQFRDIDPVEAEAVREGLVNNLEQAKRFGEPARVVETVADSPNPEMTFDRNPDAPEAFKQEAVAHIDSIPKEDLQSNFKNINGMTLAMLRVMSPSQVLEKMGLRKEGLDIHTGLLRAESAVNKANKADSDVLTAINEVLPKNKEAQNQIIDYLQGNRKTLSAIDDTEAADMIRSWLDEKKAGLEQLGFKTLDDYFPHMFDKNDPDVQRMFKGKTTADISFNNLKSRIANSEDYSRDIMDVLTRYAQSYNRKTLLEPALKPLDDLKTQVNLTNAEANWVDEYITQLKGFKTSKAGESYNQIMDTIYDKIGLGSQVGEDHLTKHLGMQRMVSALATMGGNVGTAVRQGTQMVNTIADIGPKYSTIGAIDGTRMLATKEGREELARVGVIDSGVSQNYYDAISKPGIRGRASKTRDTVTKTLMAGIRGADISLRAQAYAGAKALAASKGLVGKEAEDFAARKVVDTQFITSAVDMPVAFNSPIVRSLTQLATFSGKQAGFLKRMGVKMVKDSDGNFKMDYKQAGSVLTAVVAATAMTEALKPVIGMRETEWVPFYDQIAPLTGAITGQEVQGGDSLYRSPIVQLLAGDGKSKSGLIQALQTGDFGKFVDDQWSSVVPGGAQIKKTSEGLDTTESGVSRNDSGKIRFLQDMSVDDQLKASLFGQYATEAGRNWINQGFPTLSDAQTQKVDEQPNRDAKVQYVDFYQAAKQASGRQEAYDGVKQAAKDGNINKAQRLADDYNKKLDDAMSSYWKKHNDMPQELQDEMFSKRIDVSNVLDNLEE